MCAMLWIVYIIFGDDATQQSPNEFVLYSANASTRKPPHNTTETISLNAGQRLSQSVPLLSPILELQLHLCDEGPKLLERFLKLHLEIAEVRSQPW